jgi:hypothetical protein
MLPRWGPSARARIALLVAFGVSGLFALAFACGPGDLSDLTNGKRDAGTASKCPDRGIPPPPPGKPDAPGLPQISFAFDGIRVDTSPAGDSPVPLPRGLDLDHTCNCVDPPSCRRPDAGGPSICTDGGRDDVTGALLASLSGLTGITPSALQTRLREGIFNVLISVTDWNGTDDDPVVTAMVMTSPGINVPEGGVRFAAFDGSDIWDVDGTGVVDGLVHQGEQCAALRCIAVPTALDLQAYVSGGNLVAHFAKIPLAIVATPTRSRSPSSGRRSSRGSRRTAPAYTTSAARSPVVCQRRICSPRRPRSRIRSTTPPRARALAATFSSKAACAARPISRRIPHWTMARIRAMRSARR